MRQSDRAFLLVLLAVAGTLYLVSQPRCTAGCRTVLEHLLTDELQLLV